MQQPDLDCVTVRQAAQAVAGHLSATYCIAEFRRTLVPVTLHRWGNSVGLRVPKPRLEQLGLGKGSKVDVKVENGCLIIGPERKRRLTMAELLEGYSPDDQPGEIDWGPPVGREVW
jgi:antitoxin MazE